jgi:hypothetical protein
MYLDIIFEPRVLCIVVSVALLAGVLQVNVAVRKGAIVRRINPEKDFVIHKLACTITNATLVDTGI